MTIIFWCNYVMTRLWVVTLPETGSEQNMFSAGIWYQKNSLRSCGSIPFFERLSQALVMSLDEFFLLLVMLLNAKANVIPDFCCATEILLHLVAGLETSYCKNSNIIRTIFTNNRGPIAGVRIIHVNYENIIFQKNQSHCINIYIRPYVHDYFHQTYLY